MTGTQSARDVSVNGFRNAHAMEKRALSIMGPQADASFATPLLEQTLRKQRTLAVLTKEEAGAVRRYSDLSASDQRTDI